MTADTPLTIAGLLTLTIGLVLTSGPLGAIAAGTVALSLFTSVIPRLFGVLYAQLLIAALTPTLGLPVALAELGVLILFTSLLETYTRALLIGGGLTALGVVWTLWVWPAVSPIVATSLLLAVLALSLYSIHRYELVRLNLVHESHE